MKVRFTIYADLEFFLEKMSTCYNNPKKLSTTEINKHTPSGYSLFTSCSFDTTKNRLDYSGCPLKQLKKSSTYYLIWTYFSRHLDLKMISFSSLNV